MSTEAQTYRERRPVAPLSRYVSSVWVQRVSPGHAPYAHRTVPNGAAEVVCELGAAPRIVGPRTAPRVEVLAPGSTVVGVRFHPGAAPSVLGLPMTELVDVGLDARELWGHRSSRLAERLACSASPAEAAVILEREVLGRLVEAAAPDPLVAETVRMLIPAGVRRIGALPGHLHVCERHLRRRFLAATGLAPKALHRMLRFQVFLALAHAGGLASANLARLAAGAGYADQAHLSRECVRLAGVSPRTLLREAERHCAGAHDHTPSYAPLLAQAA